MSERPTRLGRRGVLLLALTAVVLVAGGAYATHALTASKASTAAHPPPLYPTSVLPVVQGPLARAERAADKDATTWIAAHPAANLAAFTAWARTQLPPPPTGADQRAELAILHGLPARTPGGDVAARWAEKNGPNSIWKLYLKQYAQLTTAADAKAAKKLLKQTLKTTQNLQGALKNTFARPSPYLTDHTLGAINQGTFTKKFSYPSKHAAMGVAAVTVLDRLDPLRAAEFDRMLLQILYSRLYARGHYPSDLVAGERLGRLIADFALHTSTVPAG